MNDEANADLIGQKFNDLTIVRITGTRRNRRCALVRCVCGVEKEVLLSYVCHGQTVSCGCVRVRKTERHDIGKTYGSFTVIAAVPSKKGRRLVSVRCICGTQRTVNLTNLRLGRIVSCGCVRKNKRLEQFIGKRFGRLTVTAYEPDKRYGKQTHWHCMCDCGKTCVVTSHALTTENTRSCGCLRFDVTKPNKQRYSTPRDAVIADTTNQTRFNAIRRNIPWRLTQEDVEKLIFANCVYCGIPPSLPARKCKEILVNGIDRIDSKCDYVVGNVQPCCKTCNFAKRELSHVDFTTWIDRLVAFRSNTA